MPVVLLVDDHALFRTSMTLVMETLLPEWTVREAGSLASALALSQAEGPPDLVVLDLHLPDASGTQGVSTWHMAHPEVPVLVLSGASDPATVQLALQAGATAFLSKSSTPDEMVDALQRTLERRNTSAIGVQAQPASSSIAEACPLSPRQLDVLRCIAQGLTSKATADALGMSEHTVRQHTAEIFRRLDVHTRAQAVLAAKPYLEGEG